MTSPLEILRPLRRNIDSIIGEDELLAQLSSGKSLRIKYGVDCTAPDLHLGHAVNLWMMRHLQEHGHRVVFLLGDTTTQIGDPTGKSETRPVLSRDEIDRNALAFIEQVGLVLRTEPALFEVRRNSEWFDAMPVTELLSLFSMTTHARLMSRDMFRERMAAGREIALHELTYPVLQGYDSFAMASDLTIVGSDQLFNEMMGRHYQQRLGAVPQTLITTRITPGLDGGPKQSKSLGNYVALLDDPAEKFGKLMSLPDTLVEEWAAAYTDMTEEQIERLSAAVAMRGANARDAKLQLAEQIVCRYHGREEAIRSREAFLSTFSDRNEPDQMPVLTLPTRSVRLLDLLCLARPDLSKNSLRRLVLQRAVRVNGNVMLEEGGKIVLEPGSVLKIGPRTWWRISTRANEN
ncbi:tyrosine--tRNA ligase [Cryobacterium sp. SO1]|uniref:tyrosine--tRNA ligase n=1 Tax=Cryobacterium sp. SO1 TaxID=1897061 RepID=UPI001023904E|nr:tyrosine--tRNA ligase [Cryobacterium sp. SO1]RZI35814.1 Tyrosine--tRNA ligase [Cryobacterium sp. SO1]